ncbi:hypothetical protein ABPG74_007731 [Tetrahymena malaccensis]
MDPKFRQQTFVSNQVNIDLNNEMFGFDFFSLYQGQYLSQYQAQQNKTYIVYIASFVFTDVTNSSNIINQIIPLDIIKCQSPELLGMNCFNLSKLPNPQLIQIDNLKIFSYIKLSIYKCQDVDLDKTEVPDNCADEQSIDQLIYSSPFKFTIKTQMSQYNITSKNVEQQYKSQTIINALNIFTYNEIKIQNQITEVQQGLVVQSQKKFSSPLSQTLTTYTNDRNTIIKDGVMSFSQIIIDVDESQTYFNIQFPIFTEVLALCNSTLAILLLLGSFCRKLAQNVIRRDIFFILMKDFFLGTYLQILEHNKITNFNNLTQSNKITLEEQTEEILTRKNHKENKKNIFIPILTPKSNEKVFQQCLSNNSSQNTEQGNVIEELNTQNKQQDDFLESLRINQNNLINKKSSINQISDYSNRQNLNNSHQNQGINHKNSDNKLIYSALKSPKRQYKLNKFNQQINQFETQERVTKIIQKQRGQINHTFQALNDKSAQQKVEKILFQFKLFKKNQFLLTKGLQEQMIKEFEQRIDESLDYFVFYKEILLLKKAVMMILSKEQFAALQVIGIDMDYQKQNNEVSKATKQAEDNIVNHFKEQYEILQSKDLQLQYIGDFLKKYEYNRQNLDNIDQRIFSSLIFFQQN